MRSFIFEWGPEGGDGLVPAIERHLDSLANEYALKVEFEGPQGPLPLSRTAQIQLYGITREALANVVKHSGVGVVELRLEVDEARVMLEVEDLGDGFDVNGSHTGHYGLASMTSRAREVGGDLEISSAPGRGTCVRVEVPLEGAGSSNGE
jgi:signal transduction histidine kinase